MKNTKYILLKLLLLVPLLSQAQGKLEGKIIDALSKDDFGLPGANVMWEGTTTGATANSAGYFNIKRVKQSNNLIVSFVGYKSDTIAVDPDQSYIEHKLNQENLLGEVTVTGKATGAFISRIDPVLTTNITIAELCKAACCNLAESFITNASVDVNYADAATGARQIQLLGLAGSYTQMLAENIPSMYGLATPYGLSYVPGPWMESIQVSKGTSSVRNGYESIAGQINIEYKKPRTSEKVYVNGFVSDAGRQEANANASVLLSDKLSTMISLHGENQLSSKDHNDDGFRDEPAIKQYNFFNRWDYMTDRFTLRTGIKVLEEERIAGQFTYNQNSPDTWSEGFGINIRTKRVEGFLKTGIVFPEDKTMSIGFINNFIWHDQKSMFGQREYNATQKSYYSSLLYQWTPLATKHIFDAGLSYKYDLYDEALDSSPLGREESVPGIFAQYSYSDSALITAIAGIRVDFHNLYGTLVTPRVHVRYSPGNTFTFRASAGKGFRSGNILAENSYLLASSRDINIAPNIGIEEAWNAGFSISGSVPVSSKTLKFTGEYFRTSFINQIIADLDASVDEVQFYNLDGKSYSNVFQIEASSQLFEGFDLLAAWRWNDVKMTTDGLLRDKPLASKYKGLVSASWLTHLRKWQYDFTWQLNGPGRVPSTMDNPEPYQRHEEFKAFNLFNAQITRNFKRFQVYVGSENIGNFKQHDPIIGTDDPFGDYFDSGLIWGPVHGRKIYAGFRYLIKRDV